MSTTRSPGAPGAPRAMGEPMTTAAHAAATKAARGKRPPPNSCHAWTTASRGWPTPRTGSAGRWRRSSNRIGDPAGDGRTQCDSLVCSTRPGRVPPVGSGLSARRQPASLPSWHTPGRTGPDPLAGAPGRLPPRVQLLVSVRGEDTQHRSPGRRHTDAPHHQEERTRVATTLARRRHHHRDRRRRSGDAPARATALNSTRISPASRSHGWHRIRSTASSTARPCAATACRHGVALPDRTRHRWAR